MSGSVWERIRGEPGQAQRAGAPLLRALVGRRAEPRSARPLRRAVPPRDRGTRPPLRVRTAETAPGGTPRRDRRSCREEEAHVGLWDDFVEAAGGEIGAEPTPETAECVSDWTAHDGYLAQLARLYAIESGQPEISRVKRDGLTRFYGINGGPGGEYFRVHEGVRPRPCRGVPQADRGGDDAGGRGRPCRGGRGRLRRQLAAARRGQLNGRAEVRRRFWRPGDRAIGIVLGIVLGIAVIILFLFLRSRNTIDEPSLSGGATTQTQSQPTPSPPQVTTTKQKSSKYGFLTREIGYAHRS